MAHEKLSLHTDDLAEYATRNGQVAGDITAAADSHLGNVTISPTMFGDLGDETGMHNTLTGHMTDMHGHVQTIAGHVRTLGEAVHGAKGDYEANDDLTADWYRRINQR